MKRKKSVLTTSSFKSRFLLALLQLISINVFATSNSGSCSNVDLRNLLCRNGQHRLPPSRHQGATNFCFAYSLADYYSFSMCENLSPLDAGLRSNMRMATQAPRTQDEKNDSSLGMLNYGMEPLQADRLLHAAGGICKDSDFISERPEIFGKDSVGPFMQQIWEQRTHDSSRCRPVPLSQIEWIREQRLGISITNLINRGLLAGRPALIHIPGEIAQNVSLQAGSTANHYVLVVGRKLVNRECRLLVRDSAVSGNSAWPREGDYYWVPSAVLVRFVDDAYIGLAR